MTGRPRIDLDAIPLTDPKNPYMPLAIFRHRTTEGLVLLIPESAEVTIGWDQLAEASVDLAAGSVRIRFDPAYAATQNWLRGAEILEGEWLDRYVRVPV